MNTLRFIVLSLFVMILSMMRGISQPEYPLYRKGDKDFDIGQFQNAETNYRKADEIKSRPEISYNLGNSIYEQNRMPEAVSQYQKAIESSKDPALKSHAYYNMGNAHFQNKQYDESIKDYEESLKLAPKDEDAKKNLMLAMRQLQQQKQQQQQKDQQKKDDNKDQNKQDQKQQDQQQQDQQQQDKNKQEQQQEQQQAQNQSKQKDSQQAESKEDISKEEAKEILKAIEREDQQVQEKLKKVTGSKAPPVKDW